MSHLLWTSDACLLMSILGWVTAAAVGGCALYMWYMCVCFWRVLRSAAEDSRRVRRAIASLPSRKYRRPTRTSSAAGGGAAGGAVAASAAEASGEPSASAAPEDLADGEEEEGGSCAICLCDFEEGDEVRLLPCYHEFCKECIDVWIERQGLAASCPLCKRRLVPRRPDDPYGDDHEERCACSNCSTSTSSTSTRSTSTRSTSSTSSSGRVADGWISRAGSDRGCGECQARCQWGMCKCVIASS